MTAFWLVFGVACSLGVIRCATVLAVTFGKGKR